MIEKVKAGRAAFNRRADVALYKYAYSKVSGDIRNGYVSCDTVADRINGGEWDL